MPDLSRNGFRSANAFDEQNVPTLSVVKDETTSGAFEPPARSACLILSSTMLPTTFTLMFGNLASKAFTFASIAATSLGALQPCQKVIVVSLVASSFACGALDVPVQAVPNSAIAAAAITALWTRGISVSPDPR